MHKINQAVILAGGLGTRLRPLTFSMPKPMVPILNKPFIEYQLELLRENQIDDIVILVGYLGEKIIEYFGDGSKFGINIKYSIEEKLLGTGGAIKNAEDYLSKYFFILNGDTYHTFNYSVLNDLFTRNNKLLLITVFDNTNSYFRNNVEVDKGIVMQYSKKSYNLNMNGVDAGISIMNKDVMSYISEKKYISLEEEIYPILINKKQMVAYYTHEPFFDIGTLNGISELENYLKFKMSKS